MGTSELSEKADEMLRKGGGGEEEKVNRNGMATISYTPSRCMLSSG